MHILWLVRLSYSLLCRVRKGIRIRSRKVRAPPPPPGGLAIGKNILSNYFIIPRANIKPGSAPDPIIMMKSENFDVNV